MKKITRFVLCCPSCKSEELNLIDLNMSEFECLECEYEFDYFEAHYIEKELIDESL